MTDCTLTPVYVFYLSHSSVSPPRPRGLFGGDESASCTALQQPQGGHAPSIPHLFSPLITFLDFFIFYFLFFWSSDQHLFVSSSFCVLSLAWK